MGKGGLGSTSLSYIVFGMSHSSEMMRWIKSEFRKKNGKWNYQGGTLFVFADNYVLSTDQILRLAIQLLDEKTLEMFLTFLPAYSQGARSTVVWLLNDPESLNSFQMEVLISLLFDKDKYVREEAASIFNKHKNEKWIQHLIKILEDSDPERRKGVAQVLSRIELDEIIPILMNRFGEETDTSVRGQLLRSLGKHFKRTHDPNIKKLLETALEDQNDIIKREAAQALVLGSVKLPQKPLTVLLNFLLKDPNPKVRKEIAYFLSDTNQPQVVTALIQASKDKDTDVRRAAMSSLAQLKDPRGISRILQIFNSGPSSSRGWAAEFLIRLSEDTNLPTATLSQISVAVVSAVNDPDSSVVEMTLFALEGTNITDAFVLNAVISRLRSRSNMDRLRAVQVIEKTQSLTAVKAVYGILLKDPNAGVRDAALDILRKRKYQPWLAKQAIGLLGTGNRKLGIYLLRGMLGPQLISLLQGTIEKSSSNQKIIRDVFLVLEKLEDAEQIRSLLESDNFKVRELFKKILREEPYIIRSLSPAFLNYFLKEDPLFVMERVGAFYGEAGGQEQDEALFAILDQLEQLQVLPHLNSTKLREYAGQVNAEHRSSFYQGYSYLLSYQGLDRSVTQDEIGFLSDMLKTPEVSERLKSKVVDMFTRQKITSSEAIEGGIFILRDSQSSRAIKLKAIYFLKDTDSLKANFYINRELYPVRTIIVAFFFSIFIPTLLFLLLTNFFIHFRLTRQYSSAFQPEDSSISSIARRALRDSFEWKGWREHSYSLSGIIYLMTIISVAAALLVGPSVALIALPFPYIAAFALRAINYPSLYQKSLARYSHNAMEFLMHRLYYPETVLSLIRLF